jgi:hypothetical protein
MFLALAISSQVLSFYFIARLLNHVTAPTDQTVGEVLEPTHF